MGYYANSSGCFEVKDLKDVDAVLAAIEEFGAGDSWVDGGSVSFFYNDKYYEDEVFEFLGKVEEYLEAGEVEWVGEDRCHWRHILKNGKFEEESGEIVYGEAAERARGELSEKIEVETPLGKLVAEVATDEEHPGIYVTLYDNAGDEVTFSLVEYMSKEYNKGRIGSSVDSDSVVFRVKNHDDPCEDAVIIDEYTPKKDVSKLFVVTECAGGELNVTGRFETVEEARNVMRTLYEGAGDADEMVIGEWDAHKENCHKNGANYDWLIAQV